MVIDGYEYDRVWDQYIEIFDARQYPELWQEFRLKAMLLGREKALKEAFEESLYRYCDQD